ncbi:MAG: hypothetical protein U7126_04955 [Microcoleus sp.]|nr:hypothetical protein [Microcoleaceae cyanobacterium UBA10368]
MSTKPRVDRDFTRLPGRILHRNPQTSAQMSAPLQNLYTAAQYEFFDTTMAPVLWQFYILLTTITKS